jgi:SAM-dependent methyltransferase
MAGSGDGTRWSERAAALIDVVRELAAAGPPPKGRPFFGLDHRSGTALELVEDLATRGIFRKYEHVLDLGGALGATTRYLASRLGCTATATAADPAEASAGRLLTSRAALDWQVMHAVANPVRLPFREAAFTHVWVLEVLGTLGPSDRVLAEAFRVLRPGGHLGVQEIVVGGSDDAVALQGFVRPEIRRGALERAGFLEVVRRDVVGATAVESRRDQAAWARLVRRLGDDDAFVRRRQAVREGLAAGRLGLVQLTARRP